MSLIVNFSKNFWIFNIMHKSQL